MSSGSEVQSDTLKLGRSILSLNPHANEAYVTGSIVPSSSSNGVDRMDGGLLRVSIVTAGQNLLPEVRVQVSSGASLVLTRFRSAEESSSSSSLIGSLLSEANISGVHQGAG